MKRRGFFAALGGASCEMPDLTPNQRLEGYLCLDQSNLGPTQAVKVRDRLDIGEMCCYIPSGRNDKHFAVLSQGADRLVVMKPQELRDLAKWCEGAAVIMENLNG